MKAHNPIDDLFQQHFAETAVPMNNQEALWQRISNKKDDRKRGFLWFSSLGLALLAIAGFMFINSNQNSFSNNTPAPLKYTAQSNSNNNQIIVSNADENNRVEETETETETKQSEIIGIPKSVKPEKIIVTKPEVPEFETPNLLLPEKKIVQSDQPLVASLPDQEIITPATSSKNKSPLFHNYQLFNSGLEQTKLSSNTPFIFDQSDSWSRCEVNTPGHFFIDVYGQAGLPMDKIDFSQAGSDQTAYRDLWDARFDPKASWHGGAQIGYEFQKGLRISGGVEYQELVTQYSDNQRITETIRVWDPQAYFETDMNGDRVWVGDTVTAINIYDRRFVRKNTHTLLHIPLQVSYDIYKKPGFHIAVDASAALNIAKTYEGQYIRSDQTLIMIDENNQDNYISKDIGVSFSAGLHFGKYLNDNWEVYASPRFRYNPNSYLLDTETLKITRNMIGLRGGLRYHF